jgi:RNA polymerase sigma-70 factor (ECF subfamily)
MPGSEPLSQTEALLAGLRGGSQEAFETIFRTYYGPVFSVAFRLLGSAPEADDIAQEAFLRLYQHPLTAGREHNLQGWLLRVAANLGYNALRSRQRRRAHESPTFEDEADADAALADRAGSGDPVEEVTRSETADRVRRTLAALPERQVQLLLLRQAGLTYAELAGALNIAPGSVGTLLARAERTFRMHYGELEEIDKDVPPDPLS